MRRRYLSLCMAIALTLTSVIPYGAAAEEVIPTPAVEAAEEAETADLSANALDETEAPAAEVSTGEDVEAQVQEGAQASVNEEDAQTAAEEQTPMSAEDAQASEPVQIALPEESFDEEEAIVGDAEEMPQEESAEDADAQDTTDGENAPFDTAAINLADSQISVEAASVEADPMLTEEEEENSRNYEVWVESVSGLYAMLPGRDLFFRASARYQNDDGEWKEKTPDSVEWTLSQDGEELKDDSIVEIQGEGEEITVHAADNLNLEDDIDIGFDLLAKITVDGEEYTYESGFHIASEYCVLKLRDEEGNVIDDLDLPLYDPITVTPGVYRVTAENEDGELVEIEDLFFKDGDYFQWVWWNTEDLEISDDVVDTEPVEKPDEDELNTEIEGDYPTYTITRKQPWGLSMRLDLFEKNIGSEDGDFPKTESLFLNLPEQDYSIRIAGKPGEEDSEWYLYTDGKLDISLEGEGLDKLDTLPKGGILWQVGDWKETDEFYENGDPIYEFVPYEEFKNMTTNSDGSITLSGDAFENLLAEAEGELGVAVRATILGNMSDPGSELEADEVWISVRKAYEAYGFDDWFGSNLREFDRQDEKSGHIVMSPKSDIWIGSEMACEVENTEYPRENSYNESVPILDVIVELAEGTTAKKAVECIYDSDGQGWTLYANSACEATVTVIYERYDGSRAERSFPLEVTDEPYYDVHIKKADTNLLPGGTVELTAEVERHISAEKEDEPEPEYRYEWNVKKEWSDPGDIEIVTCDNSETETCIVTAANSGAGGAWVSVSVYTDSAESAQPVCKNDVYVSVNNFILKDGKDPTLERYLMKGDSMEVQPVVYTQTESGETTPISLDDYDVEYTWECPDGIEPSEPDEDGVYTLTILEDDWNGDVYLHADITPTQEKFEESFTAEYGWWVDTTDQNLDFSDMRGGYETWVFDDEELAIKAYPGASLLANGRRLQIDLVDEDDTVIPQGTGESACYEFDSDTNTITLYGKTLYDLYSDDERESEFFIRARILDKNDVDAIEPVIYRLVPRKSQDYIDETNPYDGERDLLPGDILTFGDTTRYLENSEHPYGDGFDYTVTGLSVEPAEMAEITGSSGAWTVKVKENATGSLRLNFEVKPKDNSDAESLSYSWKWNIVNDIDYYGMEINTENGTNYMLPEQEQDLNVMVFHVVGTVEDGKPVYTSTLLDTEEYTLDTKLDNWEALSIYGTHVTAWGTAGDDIVHVEAINNNGEYLADGEIYLCVKDCYYAIEAESYYNVGTTGQIKIEPKLMHYDTDLENGSEQVDATFTLNDVGEKCCNFDSTDQKVFTTNNPNEDGSVYASWFEIGLASEIQDDRGEPVREGFVGQFSFCDHKKMQDSPETIVQPTCEKSGEKGTRCADCGFVPEDTKSEIAALGHAWSEVDAEKEPTCESDGLGYRYCTRCGKDDAVVIPATGHSWSAWTTVSPATTEAKEKQQRECTVCHTKEEREVGEKLQPSTEAPSTPSTEAPSTPSTEATGTGSAQTPGTESAGAGSGTGAVQEPFIELNATSIPMKLKQSTKVIKVKMAEGDSIVSWESSNKKVVTVTNKGKIKAKKKGKATITVTLASGKTASFVVKVQKNKVTTKKVTGVTKKITLAKGKKYKLTPVLKPLTSQDKITYTSSNKKVATVDKKGNIQAKGKGTAKITVKSGKKKAICTVTVK